MRRFLFLVFTCLAALTHPGCGLVDRPAPVSERVNEVVEGLGSDVMQEREAAVEKLDEMSAEGLTPAESRAVLRAAARPFPPLEYEWRDAASELVRAAAAEPRSDHVAIIEKNFSSYSQLAKHDALRLLARLPDRKAIATYVELVAASAPDLGSLPTGSLAEEPRRCETLFPALLAHVGNDGLQWGICEICLACLQHGDLPPDRVGDVAAALAPVARHYRSLLMPLQEATGETWIWEDEYQQYRDITALIVDVLGHTEGPDAQHELAAALEYSDPRLQLFAVLGSLRIGRPVPATVVEHVAASAEVRNWLFRGLLEIGRTDLFPSRYATQEAFAESDMVHWLVYPTELARTPDEIELMEVVSHRFSEGIGDYYLFRFRTFPPHWAADDGWMAGVAGPFMRETAPSTESHGDTFSTFEPWDSKTPEEHVEEITGLLAESREMWESE